MMKKIIQSLSICVITAFIASCSVGSNGSGQQNIPVYKLENSKSVYISTISTIPSTNYTPGEYAIISITNSLNNTITLQNSQIIANGQNIAGVASYIDLSQCMQIKKNSSCNAKVFTNPTSQSYFLTLTYVDSSNQNHIANQVISYNAMLPTQNGFIYDASQLNLVYGKGLTIPFRLADNYSNISVLLNDNPATFSCYKNNYDANTLCSVNINNADSKQILNGTTNQLKIIGYNSNSQIKNTANAILVLTNNQSANIITSGVNVVINPDDGSKPQTVYLVNNGNISATGLSISPQNPVTVSSNTCTTTLAANSSCSFVINVSGSITSGQSSVLVSYNNGSNSQVLYFNVSYINQLTPGLTLTASGSFSNIVTNSGPINMAINVTNTGALTLTNLQFSNLNLQNNQMSSFTIGSNCQNGGSLLIGQSCLMNLTYSPIINESGTVNFIPTASYSNPSGGSSLSYANSILNIPYSSIGVESFIIVGELGLVISSTGANPGTWTANNNSALANNTVIVNGIAINNGTYAVMLNSGVVESSTQNGIFWKIGGATNLSASTCGIVTDGTNYYICGTPGSTIGNCTSTLRGCIESSSNLRTWSGTFMPAQNVAFNNIYYYTNGTNKAYIATAANATANTGIAASTNGITFSAPTSTGLASTNSNLIGTAFNTATNTIAAWATTGFSTSVGIASVTGTWTNGGTGTTNRPANSPVRAAIFQNGIYTVTTAAGNIYTSTSNAGPYTQVFTGTSQINGITFGNGTYLAARAAGAIESQTGGVWTNDGTTSTNYNAAYFDGTNYWLTGTSAIRTSTTAPPGSSWASPGLIGITKNGSNYLAIDTWGFIYKSSDLSNWTQESNPSGQVLNDIYCAGTNLCFVVGNNGAVLKSTDGNTWVQESTNSTATLNSIVCYAGKCVIVGNAGTGVSITSNDYTTWTVQNTTIPTTRLNGVSVLNNAYYSVGNAGSIFVSTNGADWVAESSGTANNLNSIACGNIGCVAAGNAGTLTYSANGITWTATTSGASNFHGIAYSGGTFVAAGNTSTIVYSTNGTTWTTGTFPAGNSTNTNLFGVGLK